jgi:NAD(P)H-hydrate epimerase
MELITSGKLVDATLIKAIYKPRDPFSHKGDFGYACLIAGSYGMMGAAVLAAKACLRSGAGKLTCYVPDEGYEIMQISAPEAMAKVCGIKIIKEADDIKKFDSLGIGPGIGLFASHKKLLSKIFQDYKNPIVIDADALNVISENKKVFKNIPANSILTPHPTEFERLFGKTKTDEERLRLAKEKSAEHKIYIVLKGHNTLISTPDKKLYFNSTGNAGMATGGSGDVLTGILTGLLAQGYSSLETCLLGIYLHGLAGDIAAKIFSEEAMIAGDIINYLGEAFKQINSDK